MTRLMLLLLLYCSHLMGLLIISGRRSTALTIVSLNGRHFPKYNNRIVIKKMDDSRLASGWLAISDSCGSLNQTLDFRREQGWTFTVLAFTCTCNKELWIIKRFVSNSLV